jgi:Tfp pilus assembly protein PilF
MVRFSSDPSGLRRPEGSANPMRKNAGIAALFLVSLAGPSLNAQPQSLREAAQFDASGRCDEAEVFYRAALAQGTPSAALLNNSGNHYLVCGQPAKAQGYFESLLQRNLLHANANLQLARIAAEQKQGEKALEYLARWVGQDREEALDADLEEGFLEADRDLVDRDLEEKGLAGVVAGP